MKVTIVQTDLTWSNPAVNRSHIEQLITSSPSGDLIVLPEMFSTGFATQPEGIAEENDESLKWMCDMAYKKKAAICGSIAIKDANNLYYNRMYFVRPDGTYNEYDKRHLFAFGGENVHYQRGNRRVVIEYQGWHILLQVCYDLRFPVWSRNANDYDAILYVANWPQVRREVWDLLLRTRAVENQCYVVGVNRVGDDATGHYNGGSQVIDPKGKIAGICNDDSEQMMTIDLSLEDLINFKKKFNVLEDRDTFIIN
ncbi:MAG: amidohydrolase [Prevotella sp.]|nr:amidohydrolase [Prevotella sp.]MDY2633808.1 amidohydrolase [Prevotella sp.]